MSVHSPLGATEGGAFELRRAAVDAPVSGARARAGTLGLIGLLVCGLTISVAAAHTDSLLPESVRPIPSWLAGPFGSTSIGLGTGGLLVTLTAMFGCYVIAVRDAEWLSARTVLMCIAALHALILLAPPLLSTDIFSYQAYSKMWALYGSNPYLNGPHVIALDPVYPFIGAKWVSTPTVYGPVFTTLSYLLAPLSIAASVLAYKLIAALASLATVALVWNAARLRGINPVKATALVGLNPLIVVYGVGGGHNDLIMLTGLVAAVVLVLQRRERAGGASMLLAAGVKLTAALLLPFALAGARGPAGPSRRRDILIGAGAAAAGVAALGFAVFGSGPLHLPSTVSEVQSEGDWHSIPGFIATRLGMVTASHVVAIVLGVVFLGVFCTMLRRVWRGETDWIAGAGWTVLALLITASSLLPWYVAWLIPLAALGRDPRLWRSAVITTGVIQAIQLLGYIPHSGGFGQ